MDNLSRTITRTLAKQTKNRVLAEESEKLKNRPVVELTLAFKPPEELRRKILSWLAENGPKEVILNITIDPSLLAGATISFKGRFMDESLKNKIRLALVKKKDEILCLLS